MLSFLLQHPRFIFQHDSASLHTVHVSMNCLQACSILPWLAWSPDLYGCTLWERYHRVHPENYEKETTTIFEYWWLSLIIGDNLAQYSAEHYLVTSSIHVMLDESLISKPEVDQHLIRFLRLWLPNLEKNHSIVWRF